MWYPAVVMCKALSIHNLEKKKKKFDDDVDKDIYFFDRTLSIHKKK